MTVHAPDPAALVCKAAQNGLGRYCDGAVRFDTYFRVVLCHRHSLAAAESEVLAESR
jgi:hypothetical protein